MKSQRPTSAPRQQTAVREPQAAGKQGGRAKQETQAAAPNEPPEARQDEIEATSPCYARLYDYAPVGYATLDMKGHIEQINLTGARLLGHERQHLLGIVFSDFLANRKDHALFHDHLQRCRVPHEPEEMITTELQLRSHTGQVRLVQLTSSAVGATMAESYLMTITVISRRSATATELCGSEESLEAFLSAAMDAIISLDADQRIVFFNAAAERLFHRPSITVLGQPLSLLISEQFHSGPDQHVQISTEAGSIGELSGRRSDGTEFPIEASISQTLSGNHQLFTVILRDISERKAQEGEALFLLRLSEHIRTATDASILTTQVVESLGRHLQVARCFFASMDPAQDQYTLVGGYQKEGLPVLTDDQLKRAFTDAVRKELLAGRTVSVADVGADPRTADHAGSYAALGIGAYVVVPLMRGEKLVADMVITSPTRRTWNKAAVSLLATVAERVWLALEKFRLDAELRESETRFREMAERVPVFIFTTTATGACDYVNQRYLDYTGLTAAATQGSGWQEALHPDERTSFGTNWQKSIHDCTAFEAACRCRAADGSHRWFRSTANPVLNAQGRVSKWFGSYVDIDDLMRTQAELAVANERLEERVMERTAQLASANKELHHEFKERQRLEHEITQISERERRSLGQALHDGVCQHLSGVGMMAATLSDVCEQKSDPETAIKLKEITGLIRSATIDAREVARGLNPVDVDADGLVTALRALAARYDVPGQTRCVMHCHEPVPVHDNNAAMHLYRIAQEAVVNASRHAQAHHISVHLGIRQQDIMLSITDDGIGLPVDHDQATGLGLTLMRYRASSIGATLTLTARPAGGTVIRCCLPNSI